MSSTAPYGPYIGPANGAFDASFYTKPQDAASAGNGNAQGGTGISGLINKLLSGLYGGGSGGGGGGSSSSKNALSQWGMNNVQQNIMSGHGGMLIDNMQNGDPGALAAFNPAVYWQTYGKDPGPAAQAYWKSAGNPDGVMQYYPAPGQTEANLSGPDVGNWTSVGGIKNNLIQSFGNMENGYGFTASSSPAPTLYYPQNSWSALTQNALPPGVQPVGDEWHNPLNGLGGQASNYYDDFGSGSAFDAINSGGSFGGYSEGDY